MRNYLRLIIPAALLTLAACQKELDENNVTQSGSAVSFALSNDDPSLKSGVNQVASYAIDDVEVEGLALVETVSSMDGMFYCEQNGTKSTPIYSENFDSLYSTQLYATAFKPKSGKLTDVWGGDVLDNNGTVPLAKEADKQLTYSYNYTVKTIQWPEGGSLLFFLQAPYDVTKNLSPAFYSDGTNGSIEFDYTDPKSPATIESRQTIVDAATSQKDVLFACKNIAQPGGNPNEITMYHALTGVKFKFGNEDQGVTTKITKVTIKSIKANGHCTITPGKGPKSADCSVWAEHSTADPLIVDYSQTFSGVVDYNEQNSSFAPSFYDGTTNLKNLGKADGTEIMMMVPQTLTNVEVVVDFTIDGTPYQRSVKLNSTWKAGELHTYQLTVNKVDVDITDENDDTTKDNVVTKNTGNVTAYLRVAVVTAWYYGDNPIAAYTGDDITKNDNWIKGDDGFYYYVYPVKPGKATGKALFDEFTTPNTTPFPGSHLEMKLIIQGVQFDAEKKKVTEAWGATAATNLETTPEN